MLRSTRFTAAAAAAVVVAALTIPTAASAQQILYPDAPFDAVEAKRLLEPGSARIEGVAYGFRDDMPALPVVPVPVRLKSPLPFNRVPGAGIQVSLFPVTPYLQAWLSLKKKKEGGFTRQFRAQMRDVPLHVMMSEEALAHRRVTHADAKGAFAFEGLKPGRYFLIAHMDFSVQRNRLNAWDEQAMTAGGPAIVHHQQWQAYRTRHVPELMAEVEVKADGETRKVKLRERIFFLAL